MYDLCISWFMDILRMIFTFLTPIIMKSCADPVSYFLHFFFIKQLCTRFAFFYFSKRFLLFSKKFYIIWSFIIIAVIEFYRVKINLTRKQGRTQGGEFGVKTPHLSLIFCKSFITFARRLIVFTYFCLLICRLNANTTE